MAPLPAVRNLLFSGWEQQVWAVRMFERRWVNTFDELQREMERYLHHVSQKRPRAVVFSRRAWQPAVDVYETDDSVVVLVDLPGVVQEEINLIVGRNSLTVEGERRDTGERTDRTYISLEIPFGPFERTVEFPSAVDPDRATASYRAGFLEVVIPRVSAAAPRRIAVTEA